MSVVAFLLCILVTTVTAIYLYRKLNPQGVLMLAGLVMLTFALILNVQPIIPDKSTGSVVFDLVKVVEETFIGNLSRAGLMITETPPLSSIIPLPAKETYLGARLAVPTGQCADAIVPTKIAGSSYRF